MFTTIVVLVGGFDENQLVVGAVAGFNLWNYDMTVDELNAMVIQGMCSHISTLQYLEPLLVMMILPVVSTCSSNAICC